MDFGEMFRVMRRRWYVVIPALLLTIVATAGVYVAWPTSYRSEVQLSLLASRSVAQSQGDAGNPYLAFTPGLDSVVDILGRNLSSNDSVAQLRALGVTYPYTAGIATNAQGPFLAIDVTGHNAAEITRSMPVIVSFTQRRLAEMQSASSAPKDTQIQAVLIAPPSTPAPVTKTKIELVAAVAVLGLVFSFLLSFIVDNLINQRRLRKSGATDQPARGRQSTRPGYHPRAMEAKDRDKTQPGDRPPETSEPVWTR